MNEKRLKHLIVSIGGIGLCIAGPTISSWYLIINNNMINMPFMVIGICVTVIGLLCCIGAILCQSGRYDK